MANMPQRRAHYHARRRGEPVNAAPSVERRIVTFVTSLATPDTSGDDIKTTFSDSLEQDHGELELGDQAASSTSSLPSAILASTITGSAGGALFTESVTSSSSESLASETSTSTSPSATKASETSSASATSSSSSSSGGSMDVAVKAGIALAVLGGLLIVLGIAYFFIMRRRKQIDEQQRQAAADEKLNGSIEDGPPPPTPAKPPRLSLRPMTGLFTAFSSPGQGELRAGSKSPAAMARAPVASAWDRAMTSESQTDHNPFGSGAERVREEPGTPKNPMTPISEASTHFASPQQGAGLTPAPRGVSALTTDTGSIPRMSGITMDSATVPPLLTRHLQVSPCGSADVSPIESEASFPVGQAMSTSEPVPAGSFTSTTASGGALTIERQLSERRQSVRKENVPAPLDLTLPPKLPAVPPSPSGTEFSFQEVDPEQSPIPSTSAAEIAAAGGPANSTVHRVQLDFNPTLDDEMGLQAGQLVRLLHEYDDGWALCIRLDRSQQGVVPRTCLSTRAVKPRTPPQGGPRMPPVNPQGRARGPSVSSQRGYAPGSQSHPLGPAGQRGPGYMRPMGQQSPNFPVGKPSPPGSSHRQQEYRPSLDDQHQGSAASKPAPPGQAY